ncbi:MAG: hypothetical protein WBK76_00600 [Candidatus Saccharimonadales bacterium]
MRGKNQGVEIHTSNEQETHLPMTQFHMSKKVWQKLMGWVKSCDIECSGLGFVRQEGLSYFIDEVFLLKQLCSGSYTDIESEYYGQFGDKLIRERTADYNKYKGTRLWWHSHVNMSAFWSGTDLGTIGRFSSKGAWMLALVVNKKGEYCLMYNYPTANIRLDRQTLEIYDDDNTELLKQCKKDIEEMVHPMSEYEYERIHIHGDTVERIVKRKFQSVHHFENMTNFWNERDEYFYDKRAYPDHPAHPLKIRQITKTHAQDDKKIVVCPSIETLE